MLRELIREMLRTELEPQPARYGLKVPKYKQANQAPDSIELPVAQRRRATDRTIEVPLDAVLIKAWAQTDENGMQVMKIVSPPHLIGELVRVAPDQIYVAL